MKTIKDMILNKLDEEELKESAREDIETYKERISQKPEEEEIIEHTIAYIKYKFGV